MLPACSYAEIYNEEITDLLAPGGSGLQIRDGDAHRGCMWRTCRTTQPSTVGGWLGGFSWLADACTGNCLYRFPPCLSHWLPRLQLTM